MTAYIQLEGADAALAEAVIHCLSLRSVASATALVALLPKPFSESPSGAVQSVLDQLHGAGLADLLPYNHGLHWKLSGALSTEARLKSAVEKLGSGFTSAELATEAATTNPIATKWLRAMRASGALPPSDRPARIGTFVIPRRKPDTLSGWFWRNTEPLEDGCVIWKGAKTSFGHGVFEANKVRYKAHRFSWEETNGPIAEGVCVCHKCDVPACVRVEHLFLGTNADNMADMMRKKRGGSTIHPERCVRGERCHAAKLTEEIVRSIRIEYANGGVTYPELAKRHGVARRAIQHAITRMWWKHVL